MLSIFTMFLASILSNFAAIPATAQAACCCGDCACVACACDGTCCTTGADCGCVGCSCCGPTAAHSCCAK